MHRSQWLFKQCALTLGVLLGIGHASADAALPSELDLQLSDIIANVRAAEVLYLDIEVSLTESFEDYSKSANEGQSQHILSKTARLRTVQKIQTSMHHVMQAGRFHTEINTDYSFPAGDTSSAYRLRKYNGSITQAIEADNASSAGVVNIAHGRNPDGKQWRPHMMIMRDTPIVVALSTYLEGSKAIANDPQMKWDANLSLDVQYQGTELLDNQLCHIVWLTTSFTKSSKIHDRWILWLAEERNYLPVRKEGYTFRISPDVPVCVGSLHEILEVEPGVWVPKRCEVTAFDQSLLREKRMQRPLWKQKYNVSKISLHPQYPDNFFDAFTIPKGSSVYVVENGQLLRSYTEGAQTIADSASGSFAISHYAMAATFLIVIVLLLLVIKKRVYQ